MYYDDLLLVPYKENGRGHNGMDCFGLVLECIYRSGKNIPDFVYDITVSENERDKLSLELGLVEVTDCRKGVIVQCTYANKLHVGYMVNDHLMLHMTVDKGARVTPVLAIANKKYYEVLT